MCVLMVATLMALDTVTMVVVEWEAARVREEVEADPIDGEVNMAGS